MKKFEVLRRKRTENFNTSWTIIPGGKYTTFHKCFSLMKKTYKRYIIGKVAVEFEIREYGIDFYKEEIILKRWRYDKDLERIDIK